MTNLRALVREIISEEIGRSYKTTLPHEDAMYNWRKAPGVKDYYIAFGPARNVFRVEVSFENGSMAKGNFKDEESANHFARNEIEKFTRARMSSTDTPVNSIRY